MTVVSTEYWSVAPRWHRESIEWTSIAPGADPVRHARGCPADAVVLRPWPTREGYAVTFCGGCMREALTVPTTAPTRTPAHPDNLEDQ